MVVLLGTLTGCPAETKKPAADSTKKDDAKPKADAKDDAKPK